MAAWGHARAVVRGLGCQPGFVIDGVGGGAGMGAGMGAAHGEHGHPSGDHRAERRQQVRVGDQHARAAVLQQEAHFLGREVPVDRAVIGASGAAREDHIGEDRVVAQQHGHHVALLQTQPPQAAREVRAARQHLRAGSVQRFEPKVCGHAGLLDI
ncbi:hypothetical protein D3C87_1489450 [compost metagenome]